VIKSSSLGDIIHALPAVSALRKHWPHARITWMVKQHMAAILDDNPDLDEVWPVDFSLRFWPVLLRTLRAGSYDLVVDFQGLFRSGLLSWMSGASKRVGFIRAREGAPIFYTDQVDLPDMAGVSWRLGPLHAVDRNLALVRHLGADPTQWSWHFPHAAEDQARIGSFLQAAGVTEQDCLVAIAPWSRAPLKCWPPDRFLELIRHLICEKRVRPVLIGGSQERRFASPFREFESEGLLDCVGKVSLRQLPVLLRHVKAFVGNDSAPLHLAAGLGIPVVGLYGPTHPRATGPYPLDRHVVLQTPLRCTPCGEQTCREPIYQECLQSIREQEVYEKLCSVLTDSSAVQKTGGSNSCHRSDGESIAHVQVKL